MTIKKTKPVNYTFEVKCSADELDCLIGSLVDAYNDDPTKQNTQLGNIIDTFQEFASIA